MIETTWTHDEISLVIKQLATYTRNPASASKGAWMRVKEWLNSGRWVGGNMQGPECVEYGEHMLSVVVSRTLNNVQAKPIKLSKPLLAVLEKHDIKYSASLWWAQLDVQESKQLLGDVEQAAEQKAERKIERRANAVVRTAKAIKRYEKKLEKKASHVMLASMADILARNRGD